MSRELVTKGRLLALIVLLALPGLVFGQFSFTTVPVYLPHIAVGGDSAGQHYVTILQIVNNNSAATNGHFELHADDGSAFVALVDGQGPKAAFDILLGPGETRQVELASTGGVVSGWLKSTYSPSQAVTDALIQYRSGSSLLSEVGVDPAYTPITATDLAFENDITLNTGIAISNPSEAPAYVLAGLSDPDTGSLVARTMISMGPNGHIARLVTELFPGVPGIGRMRAKVSLDSCNSQCSSLGGNGFLATAFRLNGDQFTTIPIVSRPVDGGERVRVLPQVAFGGPTDGQNMKTVLYATTDGSSGVFGTVDIFDNGGNPLAASLDGAPPSSSIPFTVLGNRVTRLVLSGDQTLRSGWIRLTLSGEVNLVTSAVFQTFNGTTLASEASVLESAPVQAGLIYVKIQPGTNVGVAFANADSEPTTVSLDVFDQRGNVAGRRDITLPANGHLAQFVTELFPELASLPEFTGSLALHSSGTFSALALHLTDDKVATLAIAAHGMHRPSVTALRITQAQRVRAQVSFAVDVRDLDSDIATSSLSEVFAYARIDLGVYGVDDGFFSLDGTPILDQSSGTLTGIFQPPNMTATVPSGTPAVLHLHVYDSPGNASNDVSILFSF